jgi:hypothetical protein
MFRCSHTILKERIVRACSLLPNSATYRHQQGPTYIYSHITTELITHLHYD